MATAVTYLPPAARRVLIVHSPTAGARPGRRLVEQLADQLRQRGFPTAVSDRMDEVVSAASEALAEGQLRAVVAAGGDGTVSLVANRTPPGVPIAVLPLGTENLLARYFGIRADPNVVARMIHAGASTLVDAGRVDDRVFLLMVSCGFDAEVVRRLHQARRGHIHRWSYIKPIWDSIRSYQYPELRITCDDGPTISARWCFIFNLPCYALGLPIVPDADGTDGRLDVCTFKEGSLITGLMYLGAVLLGRHQTWDDCQMRCVQRVRIEADGPVPFEVDGDPGGALPLELSVLPGHFRLMVPPAWVARQQTRSARRRSQRRS